MRKTKIVCTLGPATDSEEVLKNLMLEGMNVARINFSHGNYQDQEGRINMFKKVRDELKLPISLLLDTQGPEIRIGKFAENQIFLDKGQEFTLTNSDDLGDKTKVSITYKTLYQEIDVGRTILVNDGTIELKVKEIKDKDIVCEVIQGGKLTNRKSINIPDFIVTLPGITEKDIADIKYGITAGFDYIAASFVRKPQDVIEIREVLKQNGGEHIKIISKIENREGIDNFDKILEVSDGIMVARGDLGVEVPMERLPIVQKHIIDKCREKGKIAVVATEMLESMKKNIRPTRAEVSDVANAVLDGTDAVMLSGETTTGKYPIETVKYMSQICNEAENSLSFKAKKEENIDVTETIAKSVVDISKIIDVKAIAAATMSGYSARKISNLKPNSPIVALCPSAKVARSLSLNYGVYAMVVKEYNSTDEIIEDAKIEVNKLIPLKNKDIIVVTGGFPNNTTLKTTNFLKVEEIR